MPLNWEYGEAVSDTEATAVVHRAIDLGVTLIDTADSYGANEELVGRTLRGRREEVVVSTKVGLIVTNDNPITYERNGRPEHIHQSCRASLARLQTEVIDVYTLHRVDPAVPVEESMGAMADLVSEGLVRAVGLSEVDVATLERAVSVHPVASVQSELSLWSRDALDEVVPWCTENGVAFLPYSPLGRGYLTGSLGGEALPSTDFRSTLPRFSAEMMSANQGLVDAIAEVGGRHNASNAQVALAWLLAQGPTVVPIPGTKRIAYLEDNVGAASLALSDEDLADLDRLPPPAGDRY